jgi:TonB family protein
MHGSKNILPHNNQRQLETGMSLTVSFLLHILAIFLLIGIWGDLIGKSPNNTETIVDVALVEHLPTPISQIEITPTKEVESLQSKPIDPIYSRLQKFSMKKENSTQKTSPKKTDKKNPKEATMAQTSSPSAGLFNDTSYALEVARHISKYKFYPLSARHRHETGELLALITLDAQGRLIAQKIEQSSGSSLLDDAALKAITLASPYPPPPNNQSRKTLKIPLNYTLTSRK